MVNYNKQFARGYYPKEHWDESTRVNGHEPESPSKQRKRQSLAKGTQMEARPGLAALRAPKTKRGK